MQIYPAEKLWTCGPRSCPPRSYCVPAAPLLQQSSLPFVKSTTDAYYLQCDGEHFWFTLETLAKYPKSPLIIQLQRAGLGSTVILDYSGAAMKHIVHFIKYGTCLVPIEQLPYNIVSLMKEYCQSLGIHDLSYLLCAPERALEDAQLNKHKRYRSYVTGFRIYLQILKTMCPSWTEVLDIVEEELKAMQESSLYYNVWEKLSNVVLRVLLKVNSNSDAKPRPSPFDMELCRGSDPETRSCASSDSEHTTTADEDKQAGNSSNQLSAVMNIIQELLVPSVVKIEPKSVPKPEEKPVQNAQTTSDVKDVESKVESGPEKTEKKDETKVPDLSYKSTAQVGSAQDAADIEMIIKSVLGKKEGAKVWQQASAIAGSLLGGGDKTDGKRSSSIKNIDFGQLMSLAASVMGSIQPEQKDKGAEKPSEPGKDGSLGMSVPVWISVAANNGQPTSATGTAGGVGGAENAPNLAKLVEETMAKLPNSV